MQDVFWSGIVAIAVLYVAVFLVGVWASKRGEEGSDALEELMLAGRGLPLWVGLLTMTATWVGGGYINGTAEQTFANGMVWGVQAGIGYALALILGGLVYARVMRRHRYATLVDPLEVRYGRHVAGLLMLPAVLAELFWSAAILVALGTTFDTVLGISNLRLSIITSAAVAVGYTLFGGLRAVAWTDVVQLFLILAGLGLAIPFAVSTAGGFGAIAETSGGFGFENAGAALSYADWSLIFILGGIPWNVYFQRVLASRDENAAARTSVVAGFVCAAMAIPPLLLGLAGRALDWSALDTGGIDVAAAVSETPAQVLPYLLRYAVPEWVAVLGLGAVAAAVMSSVDSSILSASSLVAWNGYRRLFDPKAGVEQMTRIVRGLIAVLGTLATAIALTVESVAALWYLCGDVVYCVLFPQLTLALFDSRANRMGALAGLATSVLVRLSGGESTLGLPAFGAWPTLDGAEFPFRTLAMISGFVVAIVVSRVTAAADPPRALDALPESSG